jgi:hypothetical protein
MNIIDQKMTEQTISKISDYYFNICLFKKIEKDDQCFNIREII